MLLRRLGASSQRNRLFLAAQELGRAHRTVFLLNWIGSSPLRQEVTAETNKIESYNGFAKFFSFGGDVIRSEEHTSELQSLMRISYAVFCLKTKNMNDTQTKK